MPKRGALASLPQDRQARRRKRQDSSLTTLTHPSKGRLVATKLVLLAGTGGRARDLEAGLQQHPLPPGPSSPSSFLAWQSLLALKLLESWREAVSGGGGERGIVLSV